MEPGLGAELDRRFGQAVREALVGARPPPDGFSFGLPPAVRASLLEAARRTGGPLPAVLGDYYLERMPRLLVEQLFVAADPAARLLWRPVGRQPRLEAALAGLGRVLGEQAGAVLGLAPGAALLDGAPAPAALHARGLFGGSAPLLGAYPAQRDLMNAELAAGADPDTVLDLRLSGNLVHELCHGRPAALPWTVLEAIAVTLGARARPEHIFPDVPGEAVPGVSLFVCIGDALARRFGAGALWSVLAGAPAEAALGAGPAQALAAAGWQAWLAHRTAPFVIDALDALAWAKLADLAHGGLEPDRDNLLARAARTPGPELPWWHEAPTDEDVALVATGVRALFQVNVLAPTFQTHPSELPGGSFVVDTLACTLEAAPRPAGVFGEPARWLAPPPLCRLLHERGARRVRVVGARRARHREIAAALAELCLGGGPLLEETLLSFAP